jgi:hypothetical protein
MGGWNLGRFKNPSNCRYILHKSNSCHSSVPTFKANLQGSTSLGLRFIINFQIPEGFTALNPHVFSHAKHFAAPCDNRPPYE